MSVKNDFATLKGEREVLEKRLAEICSTLERLDDRRNPLVQKSAKHFAERERCEFIH